MASRMEVNMSRLLLQCEKMAAADECDNNWRYEQYVKALQSQYDTLKSSPSIPSAEKMSEFKRRIEHLQSFLPADPAVSALPAEPLTQLMTPTSRQTPCNPVSGRQVSALPAEPLTQLMTPTSRPTPYNPVSGRQVSALPAEPLCRPAAVPASSPVITVTGHGGGVLTELRHRRSGRHQADSRAQLLGTPATESAAASAAGAGSVEDDFEQVMKRHHQMQERAAEEMLALTRNLKEQSLVAKNVIAKDRETLERSSALTDKNTGRLMVESQRLAEFSRRACRCWLWIMLAVVCATFMAMVVFIRLFGKKTLAVEPVPAVLAVTAAPAATPDVGSAASAGGRSGGALCGWLGWLLPLCDDT